MSKGGTRMLESAEVTTIGPGIDWTMIASIVILLTIISLITFGFLLLSRIRRDVRRIAEGVDRLSAERDRVLS